MNLVTVINHHLNKFNDPEMQKHTSIMSMQIGKYYVIAVGHGKIVGGINTHGVYIVKNGQLTDFDPSSVNKHQRFEIVKNLKNQGYSVTSIHQVLHSIAYSTVYNDFKKA